MNNWFSHAHLVHIQRLLRTDYPFPAFMRCMIDDVVFPDGARINFKDQGITLLFDLVGFDPYERFTDLLTFRNAFTRWVFSHPSGPTSYVAPQLEELYALRGTPGGWRQVDSLFSCLAGVSLSHVADHLRILHHADDPGLHGNTCFSVDLKVTAYDLVNNFSDIRWTAMGSRLDLILPFAEKVLKTQAAQYLNLSTIGSPSDDLSYSDRVARAKPTSVTIYLNGRAIIAVPVNEQKGAQPFELEWIKTVFMNKDRDTVESVIAVAPPRVANLFKGRLLEDEMGL